MEKKSRGVKRWGGWLIAGISAYLLWQNGEQWLRKILLALAQNNSARQFASSNPIARQVAGRFVAGETIEDAIEVTKKLNAKGMMVTLDYLGESVSSLAEAETAKNEIIRLLDAIDQHNLAANVSIKPTQVGLALDQEAAAQNIHELVAHAKKLGNKIRLDMEDSPWIDATLTIYNNLLKQGLGNVGVVIQSYLFRSEKDVERLVKDGAWVRLVKGAYLEPSSLAFPIKADTDANFVKLMALLLSEKARSQGVYAGIATHDDTMIQATTDYAKTHDISADEYEFQMLYGIRRQRKEALIKEGYQLRVYVPYGEAWYPYFVRRLAERPANLWFFLKNIRGN